MIETKDLILDKGKIEDWKSMYENVWRHEETARYMMWKVKETEQEGYDMTQGLIEFQKVNPTMYFVYEKESKMPIGYAGMKEMSEGIFEDSGIAVGPSFCGKGYGKQILCALLHQAFNVLGAERFIYSCWEENVVSNHLAKTVGLVFTHAEEMVDQRSGKKFMMNYYER